MKHLGLVALILAAGCGGGPPVSDTKRINELSASERNELCEYWIDQLGPRREITCSNGDTQVVGSEPSELDDCVESFDAFEATGCTVTVELLDQCILSQTELSDAQVCEGGDPVECERLEAYEDECTPETDDDDDEPSDPPDDL